MHKLVIQDDEGKTTVVPLIRDEITVGRKEGNTIRLTERNVSRRHARILRQNGTVAIEDLNSYNGVRVNGSRIQGRIGLNVSDRIQIGDYLIELKAESAAIPVVDASNDETQPIETALPGGAPPPEMPVAALIDPDAETTRMPSPFEQSVPGTAMSQQAVDALAATTPIVPHAPQPEGGYGRLVILSTNFAGRELELSKPAMVIGRTDENDLVINHRSISRHHAKIVRENGRYAIVDLQSSNGVRVNGEEYSKVELRRGDVVDLGHVRLRFVEPGEDFVFGRDAGPVAIPTGGNRTLVYAAIGILIIGAIAIFALTRGGGDGEDGDKAGTVAGPTGPDVTAGADPDQDNPGPAAAADLDKIKPHIKAARAAIDKEDWAGAVKEAKKALAVQKDNRQANELLSKAKLEQASKASYEKFSKAVRKNDHKKVATTFEEIDSDSIYKDRAREDHDKLREEYTDAIASQARQLANARKCQDLEALVEKAKAVWPQAGEAISEIECEAKTRVAKADDPPKKRAARRTKKDPPKKKKDDTGTSGSDSKPSGKDLDQLTQETKDAFKKGQYGLALRRCKEALKIKSDQETITLCGLAACNLKNSRQAKRYYDKAIAGRKTFILQSCLKQGIDPRK